MASTIFPLVTFFFIESYSSIHITLPEADICISISMHRRAAYKGLNNIWFGNTAKRSQHKNFDFRLLSHMHWITGTQNDWMWQRIYKCNRIIFQLTKIYIWPPYFKITTSHTSVITLSKRDDNVNKKSYCQNWIICVIFQLLKFIAPLLSLTYSSSSSTIELGKHMSKSLAQRPGWDSSQNMVVLCWLSTPQRWRISLPASGLFLKSMTHMHIVL